MEPSPDPAGAPEKPVDPGISQIPVSVNKPETSPPPFAPAAQPEPTAPAPDPSSTPAPGPEPSVPPMPATTPTPPAPQQVVTPAGIPSLPPEPGTQPAVTVGGGGLPPASGSKVFMANPPKEPSPGRPKIPKKFLAPIAALLVIIAGSAAFYFGYYQNPSVIYSQSLSNTGKGYMSLVDYLDKQSKLDNKGYTGSGTYSIKSSGYSTDGQFGYKSNNRDTEFTFNIGAAVTRINADVRAIKSTGSTPDIYFKLDGIKGLGASLGDASYDRTLNKLDGQWIVIDHTLIDNLQASAAQSSNKSTTPTRDQMMDEARAFGRVNQQYVFTTDKDKAVTKVVKKYGIENIEGHRVYHYQVALQPANVKKYILAQRDALLDSKLDDWIKQNNYETSVSDSFNKAADSTKSIKSSDTFDIWMDTGHRVIYKVRVSDHPNPAENYVDIGLDYKGGGDYPFFISGVSKDSASTTNFSLTTDVNTDTRGLGFKFNDQMSGSTSMTLSSAFNLKPNDTAPTIAKPANAIQISQVLSELGLGGLDDSGGTSSSSGGSAGLDDKLTAGGTPGAADSAVLSIKNLLLSGVTGH